VWWETKNICRWPILLVISVPKIFANGQFYFNLSSKTWSPVFLEHSVYWPFYFSSSPHVTLWQSFTSDSFKIVELHKMWSIWQSILNMFNPKSHQNSAQNWTWPIMLDSENAHQWTSLNLYQTLNSSQWTAH